MAKNTQAASVSTGGAEGKGLSERKLNLETILILPEVKAYNRDVVHAILTKPEYTKSEALAVLKRYYGEEG